MPMMNKEDKPMVSAEDMKKCESGDKADMHGKMQKHMDSGKSHGE